MRLFIDARIHCALQVIQVMFGHPVIDEHAARMDKHKMFLQSQPNMLRPNLNMQVRVLAPRAYASAVVSSPSVLQEHRVRSLTEYARKFEFPSTERARFLKCQISMKTCM